MEARLGHVTASLSWKGAQTLLLKDATIPTLSKNTDFLVQYMGIWEILQQYVLRTNAKKVLEFGTREGYSTRIFANALKATLGHIWTVDICEHKMTAEELEGYDNITFIKEDVMKLDWKEPVDILYIDDWHDPYHVYAELDRWAHLAKVIMLHDVLQSYELPEGILKGIIHWCAVNYLPFSFYPLNGCGLIIIDRKPFDQLYPNWEIISNDEFKKRQEKGNYEGNDNSASSTGNSVETSKLGD